MTDVQKIQIILDSAKMERRTKAEDVYNKYKYEIYDNSDVKDHQKYIGQLLDIVEM